MCAFDAPPSPSTTGTRGGAGKRRGGHHAEQAGRVQHRPVSAAAVRCLVPQHCPPLLHSRGRCQQQQAKLCPHLICSSLLSLSCLRALRLTTITPPPRPYIPASRRHHAIPPLAFLTVQAAGNAGSRPAGHRCGHHPAHAWLPQEPHLRQVAGGGSTAAGHHTACPSSHRLQPIQRHPCCRRCCLTLCCSVVEPAAAYPLVQYATHPLAAPCFKYFCVLYLVP